MEVKGQHHTLTALPPSKNPGTCHNGPQNRSGWFGEKKNLRPCRDSNPGSSSL